VPSAVCFLSFSSSGHYYSFIQEPPTAEQMESGEPGRWLEFNGLFSLSAWLSVIASAAPQASFVWPLN